MSQYMDDPYEYDLVCILALNSIHDIATLW